MGPGDPAPTGLDPTGFGAVDAALSDLGAGGELCRLVLAVRRLGCWVLLVDVDPALRELVELVGLADVLLGAAAEGAP